MKYTSILFFVTLGWSIASCNTNETKTSAELVESEAFEPAFDTAHYSIIKPSEHDTPWLMTYHAAELPMKELLIVEEALQRYISNYNKEGRKLYESKKSDFPDRRPSEKYFVVDLPNYWQQFIPIQNEKNGKEVWVNAFTDKIAPESWKTKLVLDNDGTRCFFNARIDVATGKVMEFAFNDSHLFYPKGRPWVLSWSEDFNENKLDTGAWRPLERGLNYNNEVQAYTTDNISVQTKNNVGALILTARKEPWRGPYRLDKSEEIITREYTSGEVRTLRCWTYGKFEVRARVAKSKSLQSAFWMTAADETWPPEIDIVEILGRDPGTAYFTNHFGIQDSHKINSSEFKQQDFSNDFHTFGGEWEPDGIRWYVDGIKRYEVKGNVPNKPFYLRLSLAIGTEWAGFPDSTSVFPKDFEVDWVKVYQRQ